MKKIAVVLSGSGVFDGAEIHESVLTLLALSKHHAEYRIFAPNIEQHHVINHFTKEETKEKRNVLVEAARIARGDIHDLKEFKEKDFDAIILPGGFGVAKNLSNFAFKGENCTVIPELKNAIIEMHRAQKPIGALCIAPALIAKILGKVDLTIGQDETTAKTIEKMGAVHINTLQTDLVIDKLNKVVTSPCYMLDATIHQISEGIENVVKSILGLIP